MAFFYRLACGGGLGAALAVAACSGSASSNGASSASPDGGVDGSGERGPGSGVAGTGTKDASPATDGGAPSSDVVDVVLAGSPTAIVIDGAALYFYDYAEAGFYAVPKDGSGPATPLAQRGGVGNPNDLIVETGALVASFDFDLTGCTGVLRFPESGAAWSNVSGCGDGFHPVNVASDGASFFYIDVAQGGGTIEESGVATIDVQPFASTTASVVGTTGGAGYEKSVGGQIAVDDTNIFWSALVPDGTRRIMSWMPKAGGPVTLLSDAIYDMTSFVLDGDNVFLADADISWVPKIGGALTKVASSDLGVMKFAVDADNVYWIEGPLDGVVRKAPKSGAGPTTTLYTADSTVSMGGGFAVDEGFVYWAELPLSGTGGTAGKVRRIAK